MKPLACCIPSLSPPPRSFPPSDQDQDDQDIKDGGGQEDKNVKDDQDVQYGGSAWWIRIMRIILIMVILINEKEVDT